MADERIEYFCEDEVFKLNKHGNINFGIVLEDSGMLYDDNSFDGEDGNKFKRGHIRVAWHPVGKKEFIQDKKVNLANRPLMPGDVVERIVKGKDTQRGYCQDIEVTACVQVMGTKNIIKRVNSEKLIPLREFTKGVAVCLGPWVGRIRSVSSRLTLQTSDGSRFVIKDCCACGLDFFHEKMHKHCVFSHRGEYYPGQTLCGPLHKLNQASWLLCTKKLKTMQTRTNKSRKTVKVMVEGIETVSVDVHWRYRAFSAEDVDEKTPPDTVVSGVGLKNLKLLTEFEHCALRLGDRSYYTLTEGDTVTTRGRWRRELKDAVLCLQSGSASQNIGIASIQSAINSDYNTQITGDSSLYQKERENESDTNLNKTTPTSTTVSSDCNTQFNGDSLYQKENERESVRNINEITPTTPDEARLPMRGPRIAMRALKKRKLRRARCRPPAPTLQTGSRLAVETVSTVSSATVVWQDGSVETGVPSTKLCPVFDREDLFPGDFVCETREDGESGVYGVVQSAERAGRTASVRWFRANASPGDPRPELFDRAEVSVYDLKPHPYLQHRPGTKVIRVANSGGEEAKCFVGEVLHNDPEGKVRVRWVDGNISTCWPQDLYKARIHEYVGDSGELWADVTAETSWETDSIQSRPMVDREIGLEEAYCEKDAEIHTEAEADAPRPISACSERRPSNVNTDHRISIAGSLGVPARAELVKEGNGCFSILDTVPESQHFQLTNFRPNNSKFFFKTVRNEIKLLRTSLPSGIWVKGFEDRMDLFSVMIRGPEKTPYEDGLFLFDFQLPANYPNVPPLCHYISYCDGRLNPNLYEEGRVCVSLLGTWSGKGTEVWTAESNLLQVIVSIQGLILVSEPYFNEPGYEKQKGSQEAWENSRAYNESVVLKMVQGMSELIVHPPSVFRAEIMQHLSDTASRLCDRLEGWVEASERVVESKPGTPTPFEELHQPNIETQSGVQLPEFPLIPASKGFCLSLHTRLMTLRKVIRSVSISPNSKTS